MSVAIPIVLLSFTFAYLMSRLKVCDRERGRRAALLERALDSGAIDDATKRELLAAVTGKPTTARGHSVLVAGWIGLSVGIGLIVLAMMHRMSWEPAILITAVSFGVLSVPMAMREMQARRHA